MADQVTVSTFLELKDNMSKGLQHLSKMLHELTATANQANDAINRLAAATNKIGKGASASAKTAATALNAQARQVERNSARQSRLDEMLARRQQVRIEATARRQARIDEVTARRQQRYDAAAARRLDRSLTRAARAPSRAPARDDSVWRVILAHQGAAGRMLASVGTKAFAPNLGLFAIEAIGSAISTATDLVKKFTKEVLEAGHNFEQMTFRIGLSLASFGMSPSTKVAISTAGDLYDKMRMLAAKLPGEAKDYVQVFQQSLPDALAAGEKNLDRYAQFISQFTAFGISRGVPHVQQIATDLQQMLQGRVQIRTRTFQELRSFIGESHKDFNKITSSAKRLEIIMKATEKASKGMSIAADTMDAKYGEMKSHIEAILVAGGQPMFTAAKDAVTMINAYLRDNYDIVVDMVRVISTEMVDAFFAVAQEASDIYNTMSEMVSQVKNLANFLPQASQDLFGAPSTWMRELQGAAEKFGAPSVAEQQEMRDEEEKESAAESYRKSMRGRFEERRRVAATLKAAELARKLPVEPPAGLETVVSKQKYLADMWTKKVPLIGKNVFQQFMPEDAGEAFAAFGETKLGLSERQIQEVWSGLVRSGEVSLQAGATDLKKTPKDRTKTINDFRFSRFDIKQEFAEGFDPDRIAVAFASDLARLGEFKVQSMNAPALSGAQ